MLSWILRLQKHEEFGDLTHALYFVKLEPTQK